MSILKKDVHKEAFSISGKSMNKEEFYFWIQKFLATKSLNGANDVRVVSANYYSISDSYVRYMTSDDENIHYLIISPVGDCTELDCEEEIEEYECCLRSGIYTARVINYSLPVPVHSAFLSYDIIKDFIDYDAISNYEAIRDYYNKPDEEVTAYYPSRDGKNFHSGVEGLVTLDKGWADVTKRDGDTILEMKVKIKDLVLLPATYDIAILDLCKSFT